MRDPVKVMITVLVVLFVAFLCLTGYFGYQISTGEYECVKTGRTTSGVRIIGKVIMPYHNEPEVRCTKIK